jgi:phosphotransferase system HPr (HPr) family protein
METSTLCRQRFVVLASEGLHLRPATMLAQTADRFGSIITIHRGGSGADARSPLSTILLEATCGKEVTVIARGDDAEQAMAAIADLFISGFGKYRSRKPLPAEA